MLTNKGRVADFSTGLLAKVKLWLGSPLVPPSTSLRTVCACSAGTVLMRSANKRGATS